jgi:hypothetical protein
MKARNTEKAVGRVRGLTAVTIPRESNEGRRIPKALLRLRIDRPVFRTRHYYLKTMIV